MKKSKVKKSDVNDRDGKVIYINDRAKTKALEIRLADEFLRSLSILR